MMVLRTSALFAAAAAQCTSPIVSGQVPVTVNGQTQQFAVVSSDPSGIPVSGSTFTVKHNARGYLVSGCPQAFTADMYATLFPLYNSVLNFTVDLSTAGCACNAAFYATAMPAIGQNGSPDPTKCGDFYCDANDVCGQWCTEMDIMEANNAALQITPHKCDAPDNNGWTASCDRGGCAVNTYRQAGAQAYGPGAGFTIDTTKPFIVSTTFLGGTGGNLTGVISTLSQPGGKGSLTLSHSDKTCGSGYLASMSTAMKKGMVPIFSLWGDAASTMSWLDEPPCSATTNCDDATAQMIISDISLATLPSQ